jgi:hypothetical protein
LRVPDDYLYKKKKKANSSPAQIMIFTLVEAPVACAYSSGHMTCNLVTRTTSGELVVAVIGTDNGAQATVTDNLSDTTLQNAAFWMQ